MKKSVALICIVYLFVLQAAAQSNDACSAMKTIMNALTSKEFDKVVDWNKKLGMFRYASKVNVPGFRNCQFFIVESAVYFEADYEGSNIADNRQMLDDLGWIIAPCFTGFTSSRSGNQREWFKDGNPSAGRITVYDRGNGKYLELEISGVSRRSVP